MDFNPKQWRFQQQQQGDDESAAATPAKIPRLFFDSQIIKEVEEKNKNGGKAEYSVSPQLHLFVPTDDDKLTNNSLSSYPSDHSTSRLPNMGGGGSYFSYGQWQELELQALIYRHMMAGAAIPPQLLLMLHKSLFHTTSPPATTNSVSSSYYLHPLPHYSHYHPALLQSGYWGKGAMDPEPGRCRRTDGKKWRCSRDVVGGQKYCERHVHRGRNRSRKPVELPATATPTPLSTLGGNNNVACGNSDTTGNLTSPQVTLGVSVHFDLTGPSVSIDHFQHAQRPSGLQTENGITSEIENKVQGNRKPGGQALRHFFDDLSNRSSDSSGSSTSLSISTSGNMPSDFSLKLATGNENESGDRERTQTGWGGAGWGPTNQVAPMGGPLAEALRSSRGSNASPACVLNLVK